jgi:two-component system LytT family response regulator
MRALLVDDERLARAEIRRLLLESPDVEIAGEAAHAEEAVAEIGRLDPELVFLDVEMPGGTGFEVLERLERVPLVVFTTAYDEHAVRAFEVSALDYLMKPVDPRRLHAALEKARIRLAATAAPPKAPAGGFLERAFVRDGSFCLVVEFREVSLFESEGNYTRLHLDGANAGKTPLLARSLSYLEERLDPSAFFRANRKELVTLARIARFEPDGTELVVHLQGGREVRMSRRQAQRFRRIMSA